MPKIVESNGQFKLTIPKDVILAKRWNSKTRLRFVEDIQGNIILKEIEMKKGA